MVITSRIHRKKIRIELEKVFKSFKKISMTETHSQRREKIRRQKMFHAAAILIQKQFRRYRAQKELKMCREIARLKIVEFHLNKRIEASGIWWSDNSQLPSKKMAELPLISSTGLKLPPIKTFGRRKDYFSFRGWGRRGNDLQGNWKVTEAATMDKHFMGDSHATSVFTNKLQTNGYNEKRLGSFVKSTYL
jgi:hypothetical protein